MMLESVIQNWFEQHHCSSYLSGNSFLPNSTNLISYCVDICVAMQRDKNYLLCINFIDTLIEINGAHFLLLDNKLRCLFALARVIEADELLDKMLSAGISHEVDQAATTCRELQVLFLKKINIHCIYHGLDIFHYIATQHLPIGFKALAVELLHVVEVRFLEAPPFLSYKIAQEACKQGWLFPSILYLHALASIKLSFCESKNYASLSRSMSDMESLKTCDDPEVRAKATRILAMISFINFCLSSQIEKAALIYRRHLINDDRDELQMMHQVGHKKWYLVCRKIYDECESSLFTDN